MTKEDFKRPVTYLVFFEVLQIESYINSVVFPAGTNTKFEAACAAFVFRC